MSADDVPCLINHCVALIVITVAKFLTKIKVTTELL